MCNFQENLSFTLVVKKKQSLFKVLMKKIRPAGKVIKYSKVLKCEIQ